MPIVTVTIDQTHNKTDTERQRTTVTPVDSDRRITYAEYGQSSGVPVVFLHGTPGSHEFGAVLDSAAQARGVRILAPSRPGYSHSSPWPTRSLHDAADSILPILDDADIQTAGLIGFSGGGPRALSTAARYPHRVSQVDIVSSATPPDISVETPPLQRLLGWLSTQTPAVLRGLFRGQAWLASRLDPSFVVDQYTADETTIREDTAEIVRRDFCEAFARHRSGAVTDLRNTATAWNIDYETISPEIRMWHGQNDTNVPVGDARRLKGELPGTELRVFEDADHLQTLLENVHDVLEPHQEPPS